MKFSFTFYLTLYNLLVLLFVAASQSFAQIKPDTAVALKAKTYVSYLASDELKGRGNYTPELQNAAAYIEGHFDSIGLMPLPGWDQFAIPIAYEKHPATLYQLTWNNKEEDDFQLLSNSFFKPVQNIYPFKLKQFDGLPDAGAWRSIYADTVMQIVNIVSPPGTSFNHTALPATNPKHPVLVVKNKDSLESVVVTLVPGAEKVLMNIVGVLPGTELPGEVILFSAHYDHLNTGDARKDSIFNGANDNASGTAALMLLANDFAKQKRNKRTIIFCAFAGEEKGLLGSYDLVKKLNVKKIIAHINMDMVGISQYRKKGFLFTGAGYSEMYRHFSKTLKPHGFRVFGDYDQERNLFRRSDNFPFALAGVPAHTIMTADDTSNCYHQECDEVQNIDFDNIAITVQAILLASKALVDGSYTPGRISVK